MFFSASDLNRFEDKVERIPFSTCWHWLGYTKNTGYGKFTIGAKKYQAHRASYQHFVGEIPVGLQLDHLCRNPACVNPQHLEPVTAAENQNRNPNSLPRQHSAKTQCKYGHTFTEANTYLYRGSRNCYQCHRRRNQAYHTRKKENSCP